jgi:hypothetical protein
MEDRRPTRPDPIAAYETSEGAERAASHLVSLGYEEGEVDIRPRGFTTVEDRTLRERRVTWSRAGAVAGGIGAAAIVVVQQVAFATLLTVLVPLALIGSLAGLVAGALAAGAVARSARAHRFGPAPPVLAPSRFEVVVGRHGDDARHRLARWWDPSAPPAGWQRPA